MKPKPKEEAKRSRSSNRNRSDNRGRQTQRISSPNFMQHTDPRAYNQRGKFQSPQKQLGTSASKKKQGFGGGTGRGTGGGGRGLGGGNRVIPMKGAFGT